ncbi:hypothetical protein OH76DRAFT_1402673 [Lentinus brumalis]|uniref:DRBM domain-containing protein n=1 Tax=Lentinus brumalis TaxID=2498619 RepID=A0A371DCE2_9APHY|nr:hypothetical protein OH76DRAFT_1402673 [Polyporus brumalis]
MSHPHPRSARGGGSSSAHAHKNNDSGWKRGKRSKAESRFPTVPGPYHDEKYIADTHRTKALKKVHETNPKSPLSNYIMATDGPQLDFQHSQVVVDGGDGRPIWRSTIVVVHENGDITGISDSPVRKSAENLAALSALYQLNALGALNKLKKEPGSPAKTLSDGTVIGYEQACHFMDFYVKRFRFGEPDIVYAQLARPGGLWQADMIVADRRIGFGRGSSKQEAMTICYTDVVQYLEKCDPELWEEFMRKRR